MPVIPTIVGTGGPPMDDRGRSTDRIRGGFVLTGGSTRRASSSSPAGGGVEATTDKEKRSRSTSFGRTIAQTFRLKKQRSTSDLTTVVANTGRHLDVVAPTATLNGGTAGRIRSAAADASADGGGDNDDLAGSKVVETYVGEWKSDKRTGFGVSQRSDGLAYIGEWYNDKKHGYGTTTFGDGGREEGKYKDNELVASVSGKTSRAGGGGGLFALRKSKIRNQVDAAVSAAHRAAEAAAQKADIAMARSVLLVSSELQ